MDISEWLRDLGLERYEQAFRDNEVGPDVLPKLTGEDLKEIGVVPVGDRRRMLEAIAAPTRDPEPALPQAPQDVVPSPPGSAEAERRQLTVMFVDLVDSTALSARLDPEDMREVIRSYQNAVAGEIARFEGYVAKFMGDGILAYFGWPQAHEDEPERAVRAGLAIAAAVPRLSSAAGEPLAARIGVATGLVVVGDLIGDQEARERAVVGETPNLAARLQDLAAAGAVVIAESTRRLIGDLFDCVDLGAKTVKGIGVPVRAFSVVDERQVESRFEAISGPSLLPMAGRDQELALLLKRWALAKAGEGQGVLLVGEAGIGKSRISRALLDALAGEPHARIRYQCSPYHRDSALWPAIQQLSRAARFAAADDADARLDKLETLLAQAGSSEAAPLIADLLGLDVARYGALDLTPQDRPTRTLDALVKQLLGLAAQQPVLLAIEDAHWVDPTTLELIAEALDQITRSPVLILLTTRPDDQPQLAAHPHVTRLTLNRLGRAEAEAIIACLGGDRLPAATLNTIIASTDGVPLFVEELTKTILETGETTIPASLHHSLMARLDRIPEVKEVAQVAACIGREFEYPVLAAVLDQPEATLAAALKKLTAAELIFRRGTPPHCTYTFKHALLQDAARHSLLKSKRRQLHARVAQVLEEQFSVAVEPELIAHHLSAADLNDRAVPQWNAAGRRAAERSAHVEAITHFSRGLALLDRLQDATEQRQHELDLRLGLGVSLMAGKGVTAPEVGENYRQARQLSLGEGGPKLFTATWGLWLHNQVGANLRLAHQLAQELLAVGGQTSSRDLLLQAHHAAWTTTLSGHYADCRQHAEQGLALYDKEAHRDHAARYGGHDPGVCCRYTLSNALWALGYPDQALQQGVGAVVLAEELNHRASLAMALMHLAIVHQARREAAEVHERADQLVRLCADEKTFPHVHAAGQILQAWALAALGRHDHGSRDIEANLSAYRACGAQHRWPYYLTLAAENWTRAGMIERAFDAIAQALDFTAQSAARQWLEPDMYRVRGELLIQSREDQAQVESCFLKALGVAREHGARSLELRAATSLGRLWRDQDKRAEALDMVTPIYEWFTEGFDTADLKDAKALLDELA